MKTTPGFENSFDPCQCLHLSQGNPEFKIFSSGGAYYSGCSNFGPEEARMSQPSFFKCTILSSFLIAMAVVVPVALAQQHTHEHATDAPPLTEQSKPTDARKVVAFPHKLKQHELANMRDHLLTVSRIQEYLSQHEFDKAADLAEKRLGMSSFGLHGAHEVAPYMPKGMQDLGGAMHHAASQFAIATQEAAVENDVGKALAAFTKVTQACVACHAAYRLR